MVEGRRRITIPPTFADKCCFVDIWTYQDTIYSWIPECSPRIAQWFSTCPRGRIERKLYSGSIQRLHFIIVGFLFSSRCFDVRLGWRVGCLLSVGFKRIWIGFLSGPGRNACTTEAMGWLNAWKAGWHNFSPGMYVRPVSHYKRRVWFLSRKFFVWSYIQYQCETWMLDLVRWRSTTHQTTRVDVHGF